MRSSSSLERERIHDRTNLAAVELWRIFGEALLRDRLLCYAAVSSRSIRCAASGSRAERRHVYRSHKPTMHVEYVTCDIPRVMHDQPHCASAGALRISTLPRSHHQAQGRRTTSPFRPKLPMLRSRNCTQVAQALAEHAWKLAAVDGIAKRDFICAAPPPRPKLLTRPNDHDDCAEERLHHALARAPGQPRLHEVSSFPALTAIADPSTSSAATPREPAS